MDTDPLKKLILEGFDQALSKPRTPKDSAEESSEQWRDMIAQILGLDLKK